MKGFNTNDGYMGFVEGKYILFASESDYNEYMRDQSIVMAMTKAQKEIAVTSQLARMELGNGPWIYHSCGERVSDSIDLYIDTFVVGKDAQGLGIGKMLFAKIKENMFTDRIFFYEIDDTTRKICI